MLKEISEKNKIKEQKKIFWEIPKFQKFINFYQIFFNYLFSAIHNKVADKIILQ